MKKSFILASVLLAGAATASAFTPADPIEKGARIADAGIGVGAITNSGGPDKAMFTQRIAFEYIIKDDLRIFGQPFSIGVGLAIDNGVSGKTDRVQIIGNYDYSYNSVNYGWRRDPTTGLRTTVSEKETIERKGYGTAYTRFRRDDISFLPQASLHCSPIDRLDTYLNIGIGVAVLNHFSTGLTDLKGFSEKSFSQTMKNDNEDVTTAYSFNDLDHTQWEGRRATEASFAMAVNIGARYWITPRWAANIQAGMVSGALRNGWDNSYNFLSVGASLKF